MGCKYVKEFTFGPEKTYVKGYSRGGEAKMNKGGSCNYAKGGKASKPIVEKETGEKYPSRKAMVKHEREETPQMQREEVIQRSQVKVPARKMVPVASREPMVMKKGGDAKKYAMGGSAKKQYADGGETEIPAAARASREKMEADRQAARDARSVGNAPVRPDRITGDAKRAAADAERFANRSARDPGYAPEQARKAADRAWWQENYPGMSARERIATGAVSPYGESEKTSPRRPMNQNQGALNAVARQQSPQQLLPAMQPSMPPNLDYRPIPGVQQSGGLPGNQMDAYARMLRSMAPMGQQVGQIGMQGQIPNLAVGANPNFQTPQQALQIRQMDPALQAQNPYGMRQQILSQMQNDQKIIEQQQAAYQAHMQQMPQLIAQRQQALDSMSPEQRRQLTMNAQSFPAPQAQQIAQGQQIGQIGQIGQQVSQQVTQPPVQQAPLQNTQQAYMQNLAQQQGANLPNAGAQQFRPMAQPQQPMFGQGQPMTQQAPMPMKRGGSVKPYSSSPKISSAKVGKVMGEYKSGALHSGSSKGPVVKNHKQAVAIALSEGRKASKR